MSIIDKIKSLDRVYIILIIMSLLLAASIFSNIEKSFFVPKEVDSAVSENLGSYKLGKVCYDKQGLTVCEDIDLKVYKITMYSEGDNSNLPILYIKLK
jgi:hypothetical protein